MNKIKQLLCLLVFAPVLASATSTTSDNFTFYYYTPDHLGNIREVVDADGKQPTYEEALAMAQHVYGDVNDDVLIGGWQHSTFNIGLQLSNSENGLNSMIYERIVDGNVTEYAYVTAGTTDNQDKIQDMKHMKKTF